jgi:hypothetical protein
VKTLRVANYGFPDFDVAGKCALVTSGQFGARATEPDMGIEHRGCYDRLMAFDCEYSRGSVARLSVIAH